MLEMKIPKRNGGYRVVVCPSKYEKRLMRHELVYLTKIAMVLDVHDVIHGFMPARSPVTNALEHRGYKYTVSHDLADFFDHVTTTQIKMSLGPSVNVFQWNGYLSRLTHKGVARQGLPTSPMLANIAYSRVDRFIVEDLRKKFASKFAYTRYADDITLSTDCERLALHFKNSFPPTSEWNGFPVNPNKTQMQLASNGRRIITGIAVDDEIHPTRKVKRRHRAAMHQGRKHHAEGLAEWMRLKEPDILRFAAENPSLLEARRLNLRTYTC